MNELIVNKDGTVTVVGDAGSVSGILDDIVKANTIPAERNNCLLYTSPRPRDATLYRMPSYA